MKYLLFTLRKTICASDPVQCRKLVKNKVNKSFFENKNNNYTVIVKMGWLSPICVLIQPQAWAIILLFFFFSNTCLRNQLCRMHKTSWKMWKQNVYEDTVLYMSVCVLQGFLQYSYLAQIYIRLQNVEIMKATAVSHKSGLICIPISSSQPFPTRHRSLLCLLP